jgi:hypothetical protein
MKKIYQLIIIWVCLIILVYLIAFIGEDSLNPAKWDRYGYGDNLHDYPIILRLTGMFISILVLTFFLGLIGLKNNK